MMGVDLALRLAGRSVSTGSAWTGTGMLYVDGFFGLVLLGLWIFCIVEVITTPDADCRNLPKLLWLLIVIILPTIGSVAWLIAGRPAPGRRLADSGQYARAESRGFPEYERLGRAVPDNPESDAEFLRQCRERAEEQRRRYRQQHGDQA